MLPKIVEQKIREVAALKERVSIKDMEQHIAGMAPCISMKERFLKRNRPVGVIAEVKKASPSKGVIREYFDPVDIAVRYGNANVEAISVLTDEQFFQGSLQYLTAIKHQLSSTPLLRKDFNIDPIQLYEARANGADAVLLIAAILEKEKLKEMANEAKNLGLDILVEVHTAEELETVLSTIEPDLLGINNRDLKTFTTSLDRTFELIKQIPAGIVKISESGIATRADIERLAEAGADGVLVGETFMRQPDVTGAVFSLVGPASSRYGVRA
ncbi:indole-3-glycerol phosphate synthase TrpC [Aneurinibacillus sp. Ricciae_BoGa-3]|uniref:indole-3-glycerol phosphate synthase TrpC n=1 Tax=Aneurinibacillus sp. Ricciae_BoGa-3 TaxID=3022697 RepID=UPI0023411DBB|nr:indole-3-glycerol phosphate synthase TrpC [Aneurinibacillus sp. Ricciae_BoGa-3]WCK56086.1 indole-3-glycerol phosphate synthase TrpC [Aneurinibacillus sp. Ricciae_BoGa-3]